MLCRYEVDSESESGALDFRALYPVSPVSCILYPVSSTSIKYKVSRVVPE